MIICFPLPVGKTLCMHSRVTSTRLRICRHPCRLISMFRCPHTNQFVNFVSWIPSLWHIYMPHRQNIWCSYIANVCAYMCHLWSRWHQLCDQKHGTHPTEDDNGANDHDVKLWLQTPSWPMGHNNQKSKQWTLFSSTTKTFKWQNICYTLHGNWMEGK